VTGRILAALLVLTLGLLAGALVPLGFALADQQRRDYRTDTLSLARTIASAAEDGVVDDKAAGGLDAVLAALRRQGRGGDALAATVVDDGGRAVVAGPAGLFTPGRAAPALAGDSQVSRIDGARLLAVVPVIGPNKVIGAVLLTRSTRRMDARVHDLWTRLTLVAAVAVAVAICLAVALARWVGRPLRRLEAAAEALGAGRLGARATPPKGPPEVRQLAERFNVMAARLETLIHDHRNVIADVTHQLRTPLAALRLRLELLAQESGPATADDFDGAQEELARLSRLVDGLLTVARVGNATTAPEQILVAEVLRERADAWRPVADERGVDLSVRAGDKTVALAGPGHLEQVLDNLIDNALTAGAGRLRLTAVSAGERVQIAVADDGPGMSEQAMKEAFRRFRTSRPDGIGLGLAIVNRLVISDGGQVQLATTHGGGLTVTVHLASALTRH
jgi:signal transduction histidine kinase